MAENSAIEWTDHTFNPWRGCAHARLPDGTPHQGCVNCYAEAMAPRNPATLGRWGEFGTRVLGAESYWELPVKWNKQAAATGVRRKVFCASLADIFEDQSCSYVLNVREQRLFTCPACGCMSHDEQDGEGHWEHGTSDAGEGFSHWKLSCIKCGEVSDMPLSTMQDVRRRLFQLIDDTPNLDWIILTKRPQNVRKMWPRYTYDACATGDCPHDRQSECVVELHRENVWLLTSISDQQSADAMIPPLLECRDLVPVLGVSAEPLVGPVDLRMWNPSNPQSEGEWMASVEGVGVIGKIRPLDWVIVGGESGRNARPMHPDWARSLRDQCQAAGVPYFFKQWGEFLPQCNNPFQPKSYKFVTNDGRVLDNLTDDIKANEVSGVGRVGKTAAGRTLDGRTWDKFPQVAKDRA